MDYPRIGANIRESAGKSQQDLHKVIKEHFSLSSIRNYEQGKRAAPITYLLLLMKLYDCDIHLLFDDRNLVEKIYPIATTLYSYVAHEAKFSIPEKSIYYDFYEDLDLQKYTYIYYLLVEDDLTLNLPRLTRLLIQKKSDSPIEVTKKERMYAIRVQRSSHPDYGYAFKEEDDLNPALQEKREDEKEFVTRARLITDISQGKFVMYYDGTTIRHESLRKFTDMIEGVVIKVVTDNTKIK